MHLPDIYTMRRATADDFEAWYDFSKRTFAETFAPFHPPERMQRHLDQRFAREKMREEYDSPTRIIWMVFQGATLVAAATLRAGGDQPQVEYENPIEIEKFYVDKPAHGSGIAPVLMQKALSWSCEAGHDGAWLGVWEHNPRAIRFYEKQGFRTVGVVTYLFDDIAENDQVMARAL